MASSVHTFVLCYILQQVLAHVEQATYPLKVFLQPTDREPTDSEYGLLKDPIQSSLGHALHGRTWYSNMP